VQAENVAAGGVTVQAKKCSVCGEAKPITEFFKNKRSRDGHAAACKACRTARNKIWRNSETGKKSAKKSYYKWRASPRGIEWCKEWSRQPIRRFRAVRRTSITNGHEWDLSFDDWSSLVVDARCHYCNQNVLETGVGLDRKDSALGYSMSNCVPCCGRCNMAKGHNFTYEEFLKIAKTIRAIDADRQKAQA
jgi:hypothetical protein